MHEKYEMNKIDKQVGQDIWVIKNLHPINDSEKIEQIIIELKLRIYNQINFTSYLTQQGKAKRLVEDFEMDFKDARNTRIWPERKEINYGDK